MWMVAHPHRRATHGLVKEVTWCVFRNTPVFIHQWAPEKWRWEETVKCKRNADPGALLTCSRQWVIRPLESPPYGNRWTLNKINKICCVCYNMIISIAVIFHPKLCRAFRKKVWKTDRKGNLSYRLLEIAQRFPTDQLRQFTPCDSMMINPHLFT